MLLPRASPSQWPAVPELSDLWPGPNQSGVATFAGTSSCWPFSDARGTVTKLLARSERPCQIPDGPPGTAHYVVDELQPPHLLVMRSTTHIPPGWDDKFGVRFTWTWCFKLTDLDDGRTRVHMRVRGHSHPWWFTALYVGALIPADFIMATGMLRGLKERVDAGNTAQVSGREPLQETA